MTDAEAPPALEFVFAAHVTVDTPLDLGDVGKGRRRIVPITGGEFLGPRLRGKVIAGGADWQIVRTDGVAELEARYTLETGDSALIDVRNQRSATARRRRWRRSPPAAPSTRQATTSAARRSSRPAPRAMRGYEAHHRLHRRTRAGGCEAPVLSGPVKAGGRRPPSRRFGGRSTVGFVRHHHHGRGPVR
jgi:hypothetical protein